MAQLNHNVPRMRTYFWTTTAKQPDGTVINLTGCTLRMAVKWAYDDADNAAAFVLTSPSGGITVTSAPNGTLKVTIAPANTSSLPNHRLILYYDIQVTDGSGNVWQVDYGQLFILPNATITTP